MKVIIPTDFSLKASYALGMASAMARHTEMKITLFHSIEDIEAMTRKNIDGDKVNVLYHSLYERASSKINELKREYSSKNIECEVIITQGKFINSLQSHLEYNNYDLLIMGYHGNSNNERAFMGSNTQKALRRLDIDILIMNAPFDDFQFEEAAFVSGLEVNDHDLFLNFLKFLNLLNIKEVHVISIDTASYFTEPTMVMSQALDDFKKLAADHKVFTHFYKGYSIESGTRLFQEEFNIDIIGIANIKRHPIKRFLFGSTVEIIANRTQVPLLSLNSIK